MAKRTASKDNSLTIGLGLLAAGGIAYLLLKPSAAAAATPPAGKQACWDGSIIDANSVCPASQKCSNGSTIAASATCPPLTGPPVGPVVCWDGSTAASLAACPAQPTSAPTILPILNGMGTTAIPALALAGVPPSATSDPKATIAPTDYLVFLQAYAPGLPLTPLFPDTGVTPITAVLTDATSGGAGGAATSAQSLSDITKLGGALNNYFVDPFLSQLTAPGVLVLIWTTDASGTPISWWVTTWKK